MKISKKRLACLLFNALWAESVTDEEAFKEQIGITDEEFQAIIQGNVEDELTEEERFKIARAVDREDKINDIITRVEELDEDESSYLNGFSATEIIENKSLLDEILRRYEKAEGWVDNSDYWYLIDDCIKDVMKTERRMKE